MSDEAPTTAPTPPGDARVEWLPATTSIVGVAIAFIAVAGLVILAGPSWGSASGAGAVALAALVALATWVVLVRPRLGLVQHQRPGAVVPTALLVRGMVSSVRIPLPAITSIEVRQTLLIGTADRVWHSPALVRTRRELTRGKRRPGDTARGFVIGTGPWGDLTAPDAARAPGATVADVVLGRLDRARADAALHRAPGGPITRTWAWPEIVGLVVLGVLSGVLFAV